MFENLRHLYFHYGGLTQIIKSTYFWMSILIVMISSSSILDAGWSTLTLAILPSLTGFSMAAFAIIFVVFDKNALQKLLPLDKDGRSPFVRIASTISHAVVVQISAMILALCFKLSRPNFFIFSSIWVEKYISLPRSTTQSIGTIVWLMFSGIGLFLTCYGLLLVLAAALSIFRAQLAIARSMPSTGEKAASSKARSDHSRNG